MTSARFLLWDQPHAYPQYDIINRDTAGPVFDLGVDLDDYNGSIYIRSEHIIEMARDLGMATTDEVEALKATIKSLRDQIEVLPMAQEELKDGIDSLVRNFYSHLHNGESALPVLSEEPALDKPEPAKPERKAESTFIL